MLKRPVILVSLFAFILFVAVACDISAADDLQQNDDDATSTKAALTLARWRGTQYISLPTSTAQLATTPAKIGTPILAPGLADISSYRTPTPTPLLSATPTAVVVSATPSPIPTHTPTPKPFPSIMVITYVVPVTPHRCPL